MNVFWWDIIPGTGRHITFPQLEAAKFRGEYYGYFKLCTFLRIRTCSARGCERYLDFILWAVKDSMFRENYLITEFKVTLMHRVLK